MNQSSRPIPLDFTESLCPICLQIVEAQIIEKDGAVYMKKTCPDHGPMTVYLWHDVAHYHWMNSFHFPFKPPKVPKVSNDQCPLDCGLCSKHLRHPTLVEIEVTRRCNLHCPVCFMSAGEASPEPSLETIESTFLAILQQTSLQTSIQLTGGEPTIRPDLPEIVSLGRANGFSAIEINTNGIAIAQNSAYASHLAESGVSGIYLQFDGLNNEIYRQIRGKDLLEEKLRAIEHCRRAGVQVVLAMTVIGGINHDQMGEVLDFALRNDDIVVGVAYQVAFSSGRFELNHQRPLSMGDVTFLLAEQSHGLLQSQDFLPLGCSHPLCSVATYLIKEGDANYPFTRNITSQEYLREFNPYSPQGSVFADILARRGIHTEHGFSVVIMNYMDVRTIDLKRLKECSMVVATEDGKLIPFCAYQLTSIYGRRLYQALSKATFTETSRENG